MLDPAVTLWRAGLVPRGNIRLGTTGDIVPCLRDEVSAGASVLEPLAQLADKDSKDDGSGAAGAGAGGASGGNDVRGIGGQKKSTAGYAAAGGKGGAQFLRLSKK